jgi:hypothetical protein
VDAGFPLAGSRREEIVLGFWECLDTKDLSSLPSIPHKLGMGVGHFGDVHADFSTGHSEHFYGHKRHIVGYPLIIGTKTHRV